MLSRRRFMFVLGGAATGLWLASTGLVRLERTFVVALAGSCSFCGKRHADVHALLGTAGHATRICDECIGLCCEILQAELGAEAPRHVQEAAAASAEDEKFQQRMADVLQRLAEAREAARSELLLNDLRRTLEPPRPQAIDDFRCSFCSAHRRDVAKLISGPRVFICDTCVGEATAVVSHVLRTS